MPNALRPSGVWHAGLLRALNLLVDRDVRVFGVEGFHLSGARLIPGMEVIVDTTSCPTTADAAALIKAAISRKLDRHLVYDLVTTVGE